MKKASAVLTVFNGEKFLESSIQSIINQKHPADEIIVVDDGSTDATPQILKSFADQIVLISHKNIGQPASRNVGIRAAKGDWIAFNDADDLWLPEKLEQQIKCADQYPNAGLIYTNGVTFDDATGRVIHTFCRAKTDKLNGNPLPDLLWGNWIPAASAMVRRDVFDRVGFFDESPDMQMGEDWNMWLKVAQYYSAYCVNQPLVKIRKHSQNTSAILKAQYKFESMSKIINQTIKRQPALKPYRQKALSKIWVDYAYDLYSSGEIEQSRRSISKALKTYPSKIAIKYFLLFMLPTQIADCVRASRKFLAI